MHYKARNDEYSSAPEKLQSHDRCRRIGSDYIAMQKVGR
jgi:hypothetical protein